MNCIKASPELEDLIKKVVKSIKDVPEAKKLYKDFSGDLLFELTASRLGNAVGNRVFNRHPSIFGITENEAGSIRAYFQEQCGNSGFYPYMQKLIQSA